MRTRPYRGHEGKIVRSKIDRRGGPCGKNRYATRKVAKSTAKSQGRLLGEELIAYHCTRGCHAWHIGHPYGTKNVQVGAIKVTVDGGFDASFHSTAERERYAMAG